MTQAGVPLMPIFFSMEPQLVWLYSPGLPSASGRNLGTRNRLTPLMPWGYLNLGQDEVHDIVGDVLFTAGNENLGSSDAVGAIILRLRARAYQAEVSTAM